AKKRLRASKSRFVFRRLVISDQTVKSEGIQVNMFARINRLTVIAHFREIAAVFRIAHVLFEEVEAGFGSCQGSFFFDVLVSQCAEKPQLPALHGQKLFTGWRELALVE